MVYFVLSTIPWSSAVTLVVDEVLQRCWKWILKVLFSFLFLFFFFLFTENSLILK